MTIFKQNELFAQVFFVSKLAVMKAFVKNQYLLENVSSKPS